MRGLVTGLLVLGSIGTASAATIYEEDFSGQAQTGLSGPFSTVNAEIAVTGASWSLYLSQALLFGDNMRVGTTTEALRVTDVTSGFWLSPVIDLGGFTGIQLQSTISEVGTMEANDSVTAYLVDASLPLGTASDAHVIGSFGATSDDGGAVFDTALTDLSFLNGYDAASVPELVRIQIAFDNDALETWILDDVRVTGEPAQSVDLPATAFLLLGGLGGAMVLRHARRK